MEDFLTHFKAFVKSLIGFSPKELDAECLESNGLPEDLKVEALKDYLSYPHSASEEHKTFFVKVFSECGILPRLPKEFFPIKLDPNNVSNVRSLVPEAFYNRISQDYCFLNVSFQEVDTRDYKKYLEAVCDAKQKEELSALASIMLNDFACSHKECQTVLVQCYGDFETEVALLPMPNEMFLVIGCNDNGIMIFKTKEINKETFLKKASVLTFLLTMHREKVVFSGNFSFTPRALALIASVFGLISDIEIPKAAASWIVRRKPSKTIGDFCFNN